MILTDELCDKLCAAAHEKSKQVGIDISFAIYDVAECSKEGASLMAIQSNNPKITLVAGGYPLFVNRKIAGGIGVGCGTEEQDCEIAEYVVSTFNELTK